MKASKDLSAPGLPIIRTAACPNCMLCGSAGRLLYADQIDRLFGASGMWSFKICPDPSCGLLWLDPMPLPEDIGNAYANYYTHSINKMIGSVSLRKKIRNLIERGYWANEYGYEAGPRPTLARSLGKMLNMSSIHRREADAGVRCLTAVADGRLLDVGCGSGEWLFAMRQRGWEVEGCDFDENAVKVATQNGLKVKCGPLEEQYYPDGAFDAVTLSHVIEHVPDPIGTLAECARILKQNGKLVLFTPNNTSLARRVFKENWRGLEPPRHLHLFSMPSMRSSLIKAGFRNVSVQPFIVTSIIYESLLLRNGWNNFTRGGPRNLRAWSFTRLFKVMELCLLKWNPSLGDCIIAMANKQ